MELSIIIPVYNAEKYIKECLDSVMMCPIQEMECILVNDGSSDNSAWLCKDYLKKDDRFQLLHRENGGVSSARNTGINAATGRYVMFLDADDTIKKDVWKEIEARINNQAYDFTAFSYITLYPDGACREVPFSIPEKECSDHKKIRTLLLASSSLNTCWGKLFRLELIKENNITFHTDLKIGEDFIFVADYFRYCDSASLINVPMLYYRQHKTSAIHGVDFNARLNYTDILFQYNKEAVLLCGDKELLRDMYLYYLRVVTNLFLKFSKGKKLNKLKEEYKKALGRKTIKEIIENIELKKLTSYKKLEGFLLKNTWCLALAGYFKCKSRFLQE